ncbi:DUF2271 domain-containing protein [Pseudoteredinibacter isoporae]|uniref:DUF2271 domain-containing protein n=1 Tax=Pseudoteredinibacter isoporae TaxID=570281 RepID=A0A7X0JWL8_9GAMM|nr:DUF2271 domain-containing protein [Pseudoteredinibacter isoporae]MBB6523602.1 hypothetical protein [Pseudoteredinibacter isoporae]NHO89109.1 DUF2271 domain-containing protein [Pseudoteredinibacter isoporae]NIB22280.1 DUF2271 domain-containing protein [Pseudoteredinibacter isoporae]
MSRSTLSMALLCWVGSTVAAPYQIEIELPSFNVGDYERPYAAVWIANSKNKPQRVVQLWYEDDRWLKDLKYFWRRVLRKNEHAADGVTGATKGPGVYTLTWDGLDGKAKELAPGTYKLCAEVAREHGGHNAKCLKFEWPLTEKGELKLEGEFSQLSIEAKS